VKLSRPQKVVVAALSVLLVSCSATRYAALTSTEELSRLVLVMEEAPDGQVSHSWQRAEDFDLERYRYGSSSDDVVGRIVLATSRQPDCYAQYLECYHQCRRTPVPPDFNQYIHDFGPGAGHDRYCSEKCMRQYTECMRAQGRRAQEFSAVDSAVDWLKSNHESVLVGSLVVIAGVVFVTVSAGAGVIVLAPVVLVASSGALDAPHIAAVSL
jgi:hypothetical protein